MTRGGDSCTVIFLNVFHSRYSILPALCSKGILTVDIVEGSFNAKHFHCFIDGLLSQMNPWPQPNSVIVMDNCHIHKDQEVLDMIVARCVSSYLFSYINSHTVVSRGMRYIFLPLYSPDYNPIELAFSAIKAYIRRHGGLACAAMSQKDDLDVYLLLNEAVFFSQQR